MTTRFLRVRPLIVRASASLGYARGSGTVLELRERKADQRGSALLDRRRVHDAVGPVVRHPARAALRRDVREELRGMSAEDAEDGTPGVAGVRGEEAVDRRVVDGTVARSGLFDDRGKPLPLEIPDHGMRIRGIAAH